MYVPFGAVLGRLPQLLIFRAGLDQILMLSCRNQFAVVYDATGHLCYGSGIITGQKVVI